MSYNSADRSERILQNRRFTTDGLAANQEAFTDVLDLGVSEIYLDTQYIPTASAGLPYSGSSQNLQTITAGGLPILKYWNRKKIKGAGDGTRQVYYFTLDDPNTPTDYVGSDQIIESDQLTNFISPKYIQPTDAAKGTEANPPGYAVTVYKSTSATAGGVTEAASTSNQFVFDYKTGVLSWVSGFAPASNQYVYISAYQYIGRTIQDQLVGGYSGSFSGSFEGSSTGVFTGIGSGSFSGSFQGQADLNSLTVTGTTTLTGNTERIGSLSQDGNLTLTGSFNHTGSQFHIGNTTQTGSVYQTGSIFLTGSIDVVGPIISNGINVVDNAIAMAIALG
jgi:hypothetical protein